MKAKEPISARLDAELLQILDAEFPEGKDRTARLIMMILASARRPETEAMANTYIERQPAYQALRRREEITGRRTLPAASLINEVGASSPARSASADTGTPGKPGTSYIIHKSPRPAR